MAKEASLWALLKEHLPEEAHFQRIETGGTGKGVPDVILMRKINTKKKQIKLFSPSQGLSLKELGDLNWKTDSLVTLETPYKWEELFEAIELYSD